VKPARSSRAGGAPAFDDQVTISVNLAAASLRSPDLREVIERELARAGLEPQGLSLEMSETTLQRDQPGAASVLEDLVQSGVGLCVDDYGTAHTTIAAVTAHPFAAVKIGADTDRRMLAAALGAARAADVRAIAKRVESAGQLDALRTLHCDAAQGHLLAPPAPADEVQAWLEGKAR
jgi:EAL domain-containing protein (putative c-di-GMP-specific phosphodiesterase class I)